MTIVISILNQKGGAGKTTIATNLAHALVLDGKKVLMVDSDPQGSTRDWSERNGGNILTVVGLDRETLPKDLNAISTGYEFVIIDGAPQIARLASAAVKAADVVLIPVQPSPYDIWACSDLVDLIKARQEVNNGTPLAAFIISRAIKNTKLTNEVADTLREYQLPVFNAKTCSRVSYPTTAAEGKTVFSDISSAAAEEMCAIREELKEFLKHKTGN